MRFGVSILFALMLVPAAPRPARADSTDVWCDVPPCSREELQQAEKRVVKHLLRAQQLQSEASARGDTKDAEHYAHQFAHTRETRQAIQRAIEQAQD
jgi:hypothetical protein